MNIVQGRGQAMDIGLRSIRSFLASSPSPSASVSPSASASRSVSPSSSPSPSPSGDTFYVSLSGSDANPGTFGSPKRTIRAGVAILTPGDILYIRGGDYTTADDVIDSASNTVPSGTSWSNTVTIAGYPGETVTIRPPDGIHAALFTTGAPSYIVVQDLILDYTNDTTDREGIYVSGGAHHIRFLRVTVANANNFGVVFAPGAGGFNELISSTVRNSGDPAGTDITRGHALYLSSPDNLVEGNYIYDNEGYGVHLFSTDPSRNIVRRNSVFGNGLSHSTAYGILAATGTDIEIYNNIVYGNKGGIWVYTALAAKVYNNTVVGNIDHGIELQSYGSAPIIRNNISYGNGDQNFIDNGGTGTPVLSNNLTTDPSFVNEGAFDFHLQAGSAARDAGTTVAAVTTDFDGVTRPQEAAYDIGAFEYVPSSPLSRNERPRIYINTDTKAAIVARNSTGGRYKLRFSALVAYLEANWAGLSALGTDKLGGVAASCGMVYQLRNSVTGTSFTKSAADYADKALEVLEVYRTANSTISYLSPQDQYIPVAVDFIWDSLTSGERTTWVNYLKTVENHTTQDTFPGAVQNAQFTIHWSLKLQCVLAVHGGGVDDAWAADRLTEYQERWRADTGISAWESFFAGGDPTEGFSYGITSYTMVFMLPAEEAYRSAMGISKADHFQVSTADFYRKLPELLWRYQSPWAETGSFTGGRRWHFLSFNRAAPREVYEQDNVKHLLSLVEACYDGLNAVTAPLARWQIDNRVGELAADGLSGVKFGWLPLITGNDAAVTAQSPSTLGLSLNAKCGLRNYVFKSHATNVDAAWVSISAPKWLMTLDITPMDSGAIDISLNGPALVRGRSNPNNSWGGCNFAGSVNNMLFIDTALNALNSNEATYGTVRRARGSIDRISDMVDGGINHDILAEERAHVGADGEEIHYVGLNLIRAYPSSVTPDLTYSINLIQAYWRHSIILHLSSSRVAVVTFDRTVTEGTNIQQRQCWRFSGTPVLDGTEVDLSPARIPGDMSSFGRTQFWKPTSGAHGQKQSTNTTLVTATQTANGQNNKVWSTNLLPASRKVVKVGGPNSLSQSFHGTDGEEYSAEFMDPFGARHKCAAGHFNSVLDQQASGTHRVEYLNQTTTANDPFLTVNEVTPSAGAQSTTTLWNNGSGWFAVRVGTRVAVFGADGESKSTGYFTLESAATLDVACSSLASGTRTFTPGSNINLGSGAGVQVQRTVGSNGFATILGAVISAGGTGAANRVTVS